MQHPITQTFSQLHEYCATELAKLIADGKVSVHEVFEHFVARIERLDPELGALVDERFITAYREILSGSIRRDGPFYGVPTAIKDLAAFAKGHPHFGGISFLKGINFCPNYDSDVAGLVRNTGSVIMGSTHVPPLGVGVSTPGVRNPWDRNLTAGGSSGGAAAAVASMMVPWADATDSGGSIRIPASMCGLVGFKPSRGLVQVAKNHGSESFGEVLFTEHFALVRTMLDVATILDCYRNRGQGALFAFNAPQRGTFLSTLWGSPQRELRIGFMIRSPGGIFPVNPECVVAVRKTAKLLSEMGHEVTEAHPSALDRDFGRLGTASLSREMVELFILAVEKGEVEVAQLEYLVREVGGNVGKFAAYATHRNLCFWERLVGRPIPLDGEGEEFVRALSQMSKYATSDDLSSLMEELNQHSAEIGSWWRSNENPGGFDLLLTPTLADLPPAFDAPWSCKVAPLMTFLRMAPYLAYTSWCNQTGQPAVSLPLHLTPDGIPVGVQLVAAPKRDDLLVSVGWQIENAVQWNLRRPLGF